jgi:hypothetical protein
MADLEFSYTFDLGDTAQDLLRDAQNKLMSAPLEESGTREPVKVFHGGGGGGGGGVGRQPGYGPAGVPEPEFCGDALTPNDALPLAPHRTRRPCVCLSRCSTTSPS